jgi:hypothetical protein
VEFAEHVGELVMKDRVAAGANAFRGAVDDPYVWRGSGKVEFGVADVAVFFWGAGE